MEKAVESFQSASQNIQKKSMFVIIKEKEKKEKNAEISVKSLILGKCNKKEIKKKETNKNKKAPSDDLKQKKG